MSEPKFTTEWVRYDLLEPLHDEVLDTFKGLSPQDITRQLVKLQGMNEFSEEWDLGTKFYLTLQREL